MIYCKGCSFKCQASDCECICHSKEYQAGYKQATAEMLKAIDERPCTSCDYFEDIAKRLRTPKGAGGK